MGLRDRLKRALKGPEERVDTSRPTSASTKSYAGKRGRKWDDEDVEGGEDVEDDLDNQPRVRRRSQANKPPAAVLDDGFFDAFDGKSDAAGKPAGEALVTAPAVEDDIQTFQLHLYNEVEKLDITIECFEGETVLDAAERNELELPYS